MSGYEELVGATPSAEAPQAVETPAAPVVSETPSAPSEPAQPVQAETPQAAQPAPSDPQDPMAPVKALLDERDRRQAAERRAAELEAWRADQLRKQQERAAQVPNVLDDPEGYHAWVQDQFKALTGGISSRIEQARLADRLDYSEDKWRDKVGDEEFEKLYKFAGSAPEHIRRGWEKQRDPYGAAKRDFDRIQKAKQAEEIASKLGGEDLEAFIDKQVEARLAAQTPAAPAAPERPAQPRAEDGKFAPSNPSRTAPSLATINGAPAPSGSDVRGGYDALFKSRG